MSDSINSLQKAAMRPGDFHLRGDARQMFANYVELSPAGGQGALAKVRRSAMVVETPVYAEPRLWSISIRFGGPTHVPPIPLSPWVPALGALFGVKVTVRTALDRDKASRLDVEQLLPLDVGPPAAFSERFVHGHQVGVQVETTGTIDLSAAVTRVLGVEVSIVPVDAGDRDGIPNAFLGQFAQSATSQLFIPANALRRQFFVQNWGTTPLYVSFAPDGTAAVPGGSPPFHCTFILPDKGDVYESPRDAWLGPVSGVWDEDATESTDTAVVTEET